MSKSMQLMKRDRAIVAPAIYRGTRIAFQRGEGMYLYDFEGGKYLDMVGGAPVTNQFAREIGADAYAPDAASAVDVARDLVG